MVNNIFVMLLVSVTVLTNVSHRIIYSYHFMHHCHRQVNSEKNFPVVL